MPCRKKVHRKQGITRHQVHKDIENAQYGENKYLLTEKYLLATISSAKRFHSRESIGDVKIERNMNRKKLLIRLTSGALQNVSFKDMINLIKGFGFEVKNVRGSHHVFTHVDIPELLNLQEVRGEAKPYQIRQLLKLVEKYNLRLEDEQ